MIRETLGISQAVLGKRIDLTGAHISRLETGNSAITDTILDKYVEAFGVDPEWLNSEKEEDIRFTGQILTGYFMVGKQNKSEKIISICLTTMLYSTAFLGIWLGYQYVRGGGIHDIRQIRNEKADGEVV